MIAPICFVLAVVCTENSNPDVMVMKAAEYRV
jgi:hypothetical protein